jgi:hypothetical protein
MQRPHSPSPVRTRCELSSEQRFERQYLLSLIDTDLFWLDEAEQPFTNPAFYPDDTPLPKSFITYGVDSFGGFASFYREDVPKIFAASRTGPRTAAGARPGARFTIASCPSAGRRFRWCASSCWERRRETCSSDTLA